MSCNKLPLKSWSSGNMAPTASDVWLPSFPLQSIRRKGFSDRPIKVSNCWNQVCRSCSEYPECGAWAAITSQLRKGAVMRASSIRGSA
eukprot:9432245-Karenia_brevis.AAC.1